MQLIQNNWNIHMKLLFNDTSVDFKIQWIQEVGQCSIVHVIQG